MFLHRIHIDRISATGEAIPVHIRHIDSFCMRNFTNDAIFDDTLPIADGLLEVGTLVPLDRLHSSMEAWFRRKGYLQPGERLRMEMLSRPPKT